MKGTVLAFDFLLEPNNLGKKVWKPGWADSEKGIDGLQNATRITFGTAFVEATPRMEAPDGIEPPIKGFANLHLSTWLRRLKKRANFKKNLYRASLQFALTPGNPLFY